MITLGRKIGIELQKKIAASRKTPALPVAKLDATTQTFLRWCESQNLVLCAAEYASFIQNIRLYTRADAIVAYKNRPGVYAVVEIKISRSSPDAYEKTIRGPVPKLQPPLSFLPATNYWHDQAQLYLQWLSIAHNCRDKRTFHAFVWRLTPDAVYQYPLRGEIFAPFAKQLLVNIQRTTSTTAKRGVGGKATR